MKRYFIGIIIVLITLYYFISSAATSIVGKIDGMTCIECQEKLIKVFKEKLGKDTDVQVIVSWKDGVGSVTFPRSAKVDEEIFKKIVEESGFKISQIKKSKTNIEELTDVQRLLNKI